MLCYCKTLTFICVFIFWHWEDNKPAEMAQKSRPPEGVNSLLWGHEWILEDHLVTCFVPGASFILSSFCFLLAFHWLTCWITEPPGWKDHRAHLVKRPMWGWRPSVTSPARGTLTLPRIHLQGDAVVNTRSQLFAGTVLSLWGNLQ